MSFWLLVLVFLSYLGVLFAIAYMAEKRAAKGKSVIDNPVIYSLSLAVYCTAWTYFGSVGRAATTGWGFLPIYLGPVITTPLWLVVLKKIILISKTQRITSIADFISSRYGKSTKLGVVATLLALMGTIPYISIQLKAIGLSFDLLLAGNTRMVLASEDNILSDTTLYAALALVFFTILFGTRKLDANERHEGLVAAIAFESVFKLIAFLAAGIFVVYFLYDGFGDLFSRASALENFPNMFSLSTLGIDSNSWFWFSFLSMFAVLFLPRQFHISVVENTNPDFVKKAAWLFPLYLFLINLFVLPIALAGLLEYGPLQVDPDTFVLDLPLSYDKGYLALLVALGGFSAATSMVIVAVIALSIMISNNLVLPLVIRSKTITNPYVADISNRLLGIRRVSIVVVVLLAYAYFKSIGQAYTLVSIGLISFTAVLQFAPSILGGIFWKRGTKAGAISGLLAGMFIWFYSLQLPALAETGLISNDFITSGLGGVSWLKPYAMFGLEGWDNVAHAAFWSLFFNLGLYFSVSIFTSQGPEELVQADNFVNVYKYQKVSVDLEVRRREAKMADLQLLVRRFLGPEKEMKIWDSYQLLSGVSLNGLLIAPAELVNYVEKNLASSIGAASSRVIIDSIVKEEPISLEEMFRVLEQTQEAIDYTRKLEVQSAELEAAGLQLKIANEKLKELDNLKAEFIATVTHELRTPITSIKSLSSILLANPGMDAEKNREYLQIMVSESDRLARLINQVLEIEQLEASERKTVDLELVSVSEICKKAFNSLQQLMEQKGIIPNCNVHPAVIKIMGDPDRLAQILVNLLSNAIKFCPPTGGQISLTLSVNDSNCMIKIVDNGVGIPKDAQEHIFERFTQLTDKGSGKPPGSGLGLYITKKLVELHSGTIAVESAPGAGATFVLSFPIAEIE